MARLRGAQRRISQQAFIELNLRFRLVANEVIGNPQKCLGTRDTRRVTDQPCNPLGFKGDWQQMSILAGTAIEHVQPCQQPELVGKIAEGFSYLKAATERALGLLAVALREHESVTERGLELELPHASAVCIVKCRKCTTGPQAPLV